jgi:hypothetical protein
MAGFFIPCHCSDFRIYPYLFTQLSVRNLTIELTYPEYPKLTITIVPPYDNFRILIKVGYFPAENEIQ